MMDPAAIPAPGEHLRVRPYALTGGRVRSEVELAIETIVIVTQEVRGGYSELRAERLDICRLCEEPISIVELSARLRIPLGVVRVIVGDLVTDGVLNTNHLDMGSADSDGRPDQHLLERILNGLQAI